MNGLIFTTMISFGLPLIALLYAFWKKRYIPYMLGILAFVVSQILIRIPILNYLNGTSTDFQMFSVMQPILFAVLLSISAGIFEEIARFIAMRYFMKQRDWQSGFLFGAGHGGIEAVLIVGIPVISLLLSQTVIQNGDSYYLGGIERIFAMVLHVGLSFIVLQAVVQKNSLCCICNSHPWDCKCISWYYIAICTREKRDHYVRSFNSNFCVTHF